MQALIKPYMDMPQSQRKKFSNIYDKHVDKIYRFVLLKVSSQELAQDLTSETFLRGWRAFARLEDRNLNPRRKKQIKNPQAFLFRIARNLVIDHYRQKGRTRVVSVEQTQVVDLGPSLEQRMALDSDFQIISRYLNKLSQDYQDVILLRHVEGMSFKQIANILDRKEATVRVMLHRGIKELRDRIGPET